jgi:hypothetical protein
MFVDIPENSILNTLPLLYLPLKKTKSYYKHFPDSTGRKYLYVRFSNLPNDIQNVLEVTLKHLKHDVFVYLNPKTDELLGDYPLSFLNECFDKFEEKKQLEKWFRIIHKTTKWNKTHPIFGKYIIVCSFLLHYAVSARSLKKQFRLFSGQFVKSV